MSMRKIREVLRLTHELGLSVRQVREATGVGKTAVCESVNRARVVGITWLIPPEISDAEWSSGRLGSLQSLFQARPLTAHRTIIEFFGLVSLRSTRGLRLRLVVLRLRLGEN
jgi:hypothetical protein